MSCLLIDTYAHPNSTGKSISLARRVVMVYEVRVISSEFISLVYLLVDKDDSRRKR